MSPQHFPNLDSLDIRLMAELEADARQTYKDLAAKLGVSRPTITNRVKRLLDNGIIRIVCRADPVALGYKFTVTLSIHAQPSQIINVADRLAACPQVLHVQLCIGRFDILAWALFRDREDLSDFFLNELGTIPGVLHVETMLTLQEVKMSPRLLIDDKEPRHLENLAKDLDGIDLKLIRELQTNAGQKARHLARKLGVYESTILRRIQRLVNEHVIRIITVIHPLALGYEGVATICLKCDPAKVKEIANAVASCKQVQYAGICAGQYDIIAWVVFHKLNDLQHFLTVELGSIPGVRDKDTAMNYKVIKFLGQAPI